MTVPYQRRPSAGFGLIIVIIALAVGFVAWGLRTPPLEAVWQMDVELRAGTRPPLSEAERELLQNALLRHPKLGVFLIEDKHAGVFSANDEGRVDGEYADLIRPNPETPRRLEVLYAGAKKRGAVKVTARTANAESQGMASRKAPFAWDLPEDGPYPQLVELRFAKARLGPKKKKRRHPVRIRLVEVP